MGLEKGSRGGEAMGRLPVSESGDITKNVEATAADIAAWKSAAGGGSLNDFITDWCAPQYLMAARAELAEQRQNSGRLRLLGRMLRDGVALQRGSYWSPLIEIERERLLLQREKLVLAKEIAVPKVQKRRDVTKPLSDEERLAIIAKVDEIMGLK